MVCGEGGIIVYCMALYCNLLVAYNNYQKSSTCPCAYFNLFVLNSYHEFSKCAYVYPNVFMLKVVVLCNVLYFIVLHCIVLYYNL